MKKLHIVIGESNMRKSSLIRALSGAGQGNSRKDLDIEVGIEIISKVYVIQSALQESYKPKSPRDIINFINSSCINEFLFPLRMNSVTASGILYPAAQIYIHAFIQAGFIIENVALLGLSHNGLQIPSTTKIATILNSNLIPTNRIAADVRNIWHWI
ncbi:hypothetical protein [Acinetobacter sp. ANC 5502]